MMGDMSTSLVIEKMAALPRGDKQAIIDALVGTKHETYAMDLFISDNDLSGVLNSFPALAAKDLYSLHKKFFTEITSREDILKYEEEIKAMDTAFDECPYPLFHSFADGMYTREIHVNGGDLMVGKIHKNEYFVKMLTGKGWVVSEFGAKELVAPCSFTAKAGVKHIGFFLKDTVWTDTHKTDAITVEAAEKEIFAESYEDLDRYNGVVNSEYSKVNKPKEMDRGVSCQAG